MQTSSNVRAFYSSVTQSFAQGFSVNTVSRNKILALAVGALTLLSASYIIFRLLQNKFSKNPNYETNIKVAAILHGLSLPDFNKPCDIFAKLAAHNQLVQKELSFMPFKINQSTYSSLGSIPSQLNESILEGFYQEVGQHLIVVNLISSEEMKNDLNKLQEPLATCFKHFRKIIFWRNVEFYNKIREENTKELYRVVNWASNDFPTDGQLKQILALNCIIRTADNVFIHCHSLKRTPAFIVMLELIKNLDVLKQSNVEIKKFMYATLIQLSDTAKGRFPNEAQITGLFSDEFITQLNDVVLRHLS